MMKQVIVVIFFLICSLSYGQTLQLRCYPTASIFLESGQLPDPYRLNESYLDDFQQRVWRYDYFEKAIEGKVDPNGCLHQIIALAIEDEAESPFMLTPGKYDLQEIELQMQEEQLEVIPICHAPYPEMMESEFLYFVDKVQSNLSVSLQPPKSTSREATTEKSSSMCTEGLTCMEKIKVAQITAQLTQLDSQGELNEEKANEVIESALAGAGDSGKVRIKKALALRAMEQIVPPEELNTLTYMHRVSKQTFGEMSEMQAMADKCIEANQKVQNKASFKHLDSWSNLLHNIKAPLYQGYKAGEAIKEGYFGDLRNLDWAKPCLDYVDKKKNFSQAIEKYMINNELDRDPIMNSIKQNQILEYYQKAQKSLDQHISVELNETHQSIDQFRKPLLAASSAIFAVGLTAAAVAASPVLLPAITAAGGAGVITNVIAGSGAVATGGKLALGGAAATAVAEFVRPLFMVAIQNPDLRISAYCELIDQYSNTSGLNLIGKSAAGAGGAVVLGGGLGLAVAKANLSAIAGFKIAAGAAGYGAYGIYQSHQERSDALEELRPFIKIEKDLACLDVAKNSVTGETAFDVSAFALEMVGPLSMAKIFPKIGKGITFSGQSKLTDKFSELSTLKGSKVLDSKKAFMRTDELSLGSKSNKSQSTSLPAVASSSFVRVSQRQVAHRGRQMVDDAILETVQKNNQLLIVYDQPFMSFSAYGGADSFLTKAPDLKAFKSAPTGSIIEGFVPVDIRFSKSYQQAQIENPNMSHQQLLSLLESKQSKMDETMASLFPPSPTARYKKIPLEREGEVAVLRDGNQIWVPKSQVKAGEEIMVVASLDGKYVVSDVDGLLLASRDNTDKSIYDQTIEHDSWGMHSDAHMKFSQEVNGRFSDKRRASSSIKSDERSEIFQHSFTHSYQDSSIQPGANLRAYAADGSIEVIEGHEQNVHLFDYLLKKQNEGYRDIVPNCKWKIPSSTKYCSLFVGVSCRVKTHPCCHVAQCL